MKNINISNNVIRRMPRYLSKLDELRAAGVERISSNELGNQMGLTPSQIRQDFSCFGEFGQQGYGYNLASLRREIATILGMDRGYQMVVIGAGNIGRALLDHFNFENCGFHLLAAFDVDERLIGTTTKTGVPICDARDIYDYFQNHQVDVAALCVPTEQAKAAAQEVIRAGVKAIWNFTNVTTSLPEDDNVVREDIFFSDSLLALEYYMAETIDQEAKRAARRSQLQ